MRAAPFSCTHQIYCHFNLAALLRQRLQTLIPIHFEQNAQCEIQKNGENQIVRPKLNLTHTHTHIGC